MTSDTEKLICTGERVIEDAYKASASSYLIYLFHIATYEFCRSYVRGRTVLDFGCGSGYGTHRLASDCAHITGIDISAEAIEFAINTYAGDNLDYRQVGDVQTNPIPFADEQFDTVISFQVMEHIDAVGSYLDEIQRVLRKDGTVVIATPDRSTRLYRKQRPWNAYHVVEYSPESFSRALGNRFRHVELFGMSARQDVIDIELKRTRRTRLATLPFTFPGAPEWYRRFGLAALKRIGRSFGSVYSRKRQESAADVDYDFSIDDIVIEKDVAPSVNVLCVARK